MEKNTAKQQKYLPIFLPILSIHPVLLRDEKPVIRGLAARRCYYCGKTRAEAAFAGNNKPRWQRDTCANCDADPLAAAKAHVLARRAELAAYLAARKNTARESEPGERARERGDSDRTAVPEARGQAGERLGPSPKGDA